MNLFASAETPLKIFCKDNDFYLFSGMITLGDVMKFTELLKEEKLTKEMVLEAYKHRLDQDVALSLLSDAVQLHVAFEKRHEVLKDAFEAHFKCKFTLSVPVLFAQIEGLLRDVGQLSLKDKFKPTVPTDIWNQRYLFATADSSEYFNAFISKLFKGSQDGAAFNRNPILHGMNVAYHSEEWSLILVLIVLEIRLFLWLEKNTEDQFAAGI